MRSLTPWAAFLLTFLAPAVLAQDQKPAATPAPAATPDPKPILERMGAHYRGLQGASTTVTMSSSMGDAPASEQAAEMAVLRPNRFLLQGTGEPMEYRVTCDGTSVWQFVGEPYSVYSKDDAPADLGALLPILAPGMDEEGPFLLSGTGTLGPILFSDALYKKVMFEGGGEWTYIAQEEAAGALCDRLHWAGESMAVDLWIARGEQPWLARVEPDYSKAYRDMGMEMPQIPKIRLEMKSWEAKAEFAPEKFAFTPPEGAEEVESLQEAFMDRAAGDGDEEAGADLLGRPAPALELELLGGGKMSLAEHKDKSIVILDFWATWCPPCVMGLPVVSGVAADFKDKGVVFYAINEQESPETIQAFLKEKGLDIHVALDKVGAAGNDYGVTGIPQTVLIGKDGTVQVVHVGFSPDLKDELTEQINSLLAGKNLAAAPAAVQVGEADPMVALPEWDVPGSWSSVATDPASGHLFGLQVSGRIAQYDAAGEAVGDPVKLPFEAISAQLRVGNLDAGPAPEFVVFGAWGPSVDAADSAGKKLWSYATESGVDDVALFDLDGDGRDEIVIGHNGGGGLHVLNPDGTLRWKNETIGNVWHVTAGRDGAGGAAKVFTTSAEGRVHTFDAGGKRGRDASAVGYASMIRYAAPDALLIGADSQLTGLSTLGDRRWSTKAPVKGQVRWYDGAASDDGQYIAATTMKSIVVVDMKSGQVAASMKADCLGVAWAKGADGSPLLVTATGKGLGAWSLSPRAPEAGKP